MQKWKWRAAEKEMTLKSFKETEKSLKPVGATVMYT